MLKTQNKKNHIIVKSIQSLLCSKSDIKIHTIKKKYVSIEGIPIGGHRKGGLILLLLDYSSPPTISTKCSPVGTLTCFLQLICELLKNIHKYN